MLATIPLDRLLAAAISDRGLSIISTALSVFAIILGVAGIWRAEYLFKKLNRALEHLVDTVRKDALRETITIAASYAAFTRSLQAVELDPMQLPQDGAFALLTAFHLQKLRNPQFTPEEFATLRSDTRRNVEKTARTYADLLVGSGLGKLKKGIELSDPSKPGRS